MNIFGVSYHSVMCDMRYIHNGIHMRCEIHFAFEDRNMAPVPFQDTIYHCFVMGIIISFLIHFF